jgi:hypothetical protein
MGHNELLTCISRGSASVLLGRHGITHYASVLAAKMTSTAPGAKLLVAIKIYEIASFFTRVSSTIWNCELHQYTSRPMQSSPPVCSSTFFSQTAD